MECRSCVCLLAMAAIRLLAYLLGRSFSAARTLLLAPTSMFSSHIRLSECMWIYGMCACACLYLCIWCRYLYRYITKNGTCIHDSTPTNWSPVCVCKPCHMNIDRRVLLACLLACLCEVKAFMLFGQMKPWRREWGRETCQRVSVSVKSNKQQMYVYGFTNVVVKSVAEQLQTHTHTNTHTYSLHGHLSHHREKTIQNVRNGDTQAPRK